MMMVMMCMGNQRLKTLENFGVVLLSGGRVPGLQILSELL